MSYRALAVHIETLCVRPRTVWDKGFVGKLKRVWRSLNNWMWWWRSWAAVPVLDGGGVNPRILFLGTRYRWEVNFTLCFREKHPPRPYFLVRRLGGSQSWYGSFEEADCCQCGRISRNGRKENGAVSDPIFLCVLDLSIIVSTLTKAALTGPLVPTGWLTASDSSFSKCLLPCMVLLLRR